MFIFILLSLSFSLSPKSNLLFFGQFVSPSLSEGEVIDNQDYMEFIFENWWPKESSPVGIDNQFLNKIDCQVYTTLLASDLSWQEKDLELQVFFDEAQKWACRIGEGLFEERVTVRSVYLEPKVVVGLYARSVQLLQLQQYGYRVSKNILEKIFQIIRKDSTFTIDEENYRALCLLYTPDCILKEKIKKYKQSDNGQLIEFHWDRVCKTPVNQRDAIKDPLSNLIYQVNNYRTGLRVKHHLMEVGFYQEEDIQKIASLLRNRNFDQLKLLKNLDMLAILAHMKGLINIAEREMVLSVHLIFHQAIGETGSVWGESYKLPLSEQIFLTQKKKDVQIEYVPLCNDQGSLSRLVHVIKFHLFNDGDRVADFQLSAPCSKNHLGNREFVDKVMGAFVQKVQDLPLHLRYGISLYGDIYGKKNINQVILNVANTLFYDPHRDYEIILPPHLLEILHESITGTALYVRHAYGHLCTYKDFIDIYSAQGVRPLLVESPYFWRNPKYIHVTKGDVYRNYRHDIVHIDKYLSLYEGDYPRNCIQSLILPFFVKHRTELTSFAVDDGVVFMSNVLDFLMEGVRPSTMSKHLYATMSFKTSGDRSYFSISSFLEYLVNQNPELFQQFTDEIWSRYGNNILSQYGSTYWWEDELSWIDLEKHLMSQQESPLTVSMLFQEVPSFEKSFKVSLLESPLFSENVLILKQSVFETFIQASRQGDVQRVVNIFHDSEQRVSIKEEDKVAAFIESLLAGHQELIDFFAGPQVNVDINQMDRYGRLALVSAVEKGDVSIVEFLLNKGAKPFLLDGYGLSADRLSYLNRDTEICQLFCPQGVFVRTYIDVIGPLLEEALYFMLIESSLSNESKCELQKSCEKWMYDNIILLKDIESGCSKNNVFGKLFLDFAGQCIKTLEICRDIQKSA